MTLSSSSLTPAAIVMICIIGPIHLVCVIGSVALRNTPAFAARGLKICLWPLLFKALAFGLIAWMFLDDVCPCIVAVTMMWLDWSANCWAVLKKMFLLWRYEIQAALDKSKGEIGGVNEFEKNMFVRYRQILRPRGQTFLMVACFCYVSLYCIILLSVWSDLALQPCLTDNILDNDLVLDIIIVSFSSFVPMMFISFWGTKRLNKFPNDNWGMYIESRVISVFTIVSAIACILVLSLVPTFDGIIFTFLVGSFLGNLLHFSLPLYLHRTTLKKLSTLEIEQLTSFDHLLQNLNFVDAFSAFLKAEFSSENLYFWLEVRRLQHDFADLLPGPKRPKSYLEVDASRDPKHHATYVKQAAEECARLGEQCIGETAPWQINISGESDDKADAIIRRLVELLQKDSMEGLQQAVEETMDAFAAVQHEIFELLRKDPYPRFLLTNAAEKLNRDVNFKRLIASEKLEDEAQKHTESEKERSRTPSSSKSSQRKIEKSAKSPRAVDNKKSNTLGYNHENSQTVTRASVGMRDSTVSLSDAEFTVIEMLPISSSPSN